MYVTIDRYDTVLSISNLGTKILNQIYTQNLTYPTIFSTVNCTFLFLINQIQICTKNIDDPVFYNTSVTMVTGKRTHITLF